MDTLVTTLVDGILVPLITLVTAPMAFLADSGWLLVVFAAGWVAFGIAAVRNPGLVDEAWHRLRRLPLVVQLAAWVLFLPVLTGAWIWRTTWPRVARFALVGGIAGWNLLMFLPRPA